MNFIKFWVHRPVFTIMLTLIVIILGGISLVRLPIDLMPDITYPTITVSTNYENASPGEMEKLVTQPIEEAMGAVPGVEEVSSSSTEGNSRVRVLFAWGTDLDAAANDMRDRLDRVISHLPDDAERPTLRKFDAAAMPILILVASSNLDPVQTRQIIEDQVKYRIERVPGVAALDVWGGQLREIRVNLYADRIKALQVPLNQILSRIRAGNISVPAGSIERGNLEVTVRTPGEFTNLEQLRETVVAVREGVPVPLREVAEVRDAWEKVRRTVRVNRQPGIRLSVSKQSGRNTVEVATAVLKELEQVNRDLPQIRIIPIINTASFIQRAISNVGSSALYGGMLAILILLLFLRDLRSTAVIATSIPVSIVATFGLLYFSGFTLNILTLGGLALGVGMLVDNSIVVLENIYRLRDEEGMGPEEAAIAGTGEVVVAIISSTLTTIAVFLPMIFIRGMTGVMFKQLAYVISFSLMCSLGTALTLVPMLAARVPHLAAGDIGAHETLWHKLFRLSEILFRRMEESYKHLLHFALNHKTVVVLGSVILLGASLAAIPLIGTEFMPQTDEGEVRVDVETEVGTRLETAERIMRKVEDVVVANVPEAERVMVSVSAGGGMGGTQVRVSLKPQRQRSRSSEQVAADLRPKLANIPGAVVRTRAGQGFLSHRMMSGGTERLQVEIRGYDLQVSDALAKQVRSVLEQIRGVTDVRVSREAGQPEELVVVDRQKAADMKLTVEEVARMIETVLAGTSAGNFRESGDEFRILVQLKEEERRDIGDVLDLTITNAEGQPVVLRNVVDVQTQRGPVRIDRKNQERIVTCSANISGRDMGAIVEDARAALRSVPKPRSHEIVFTGDYEEQKKAGRELGLSITLALLLVYMVMASQYESLRDPFVVMFSVPLAAIGVCLILFLTNTTFNVQSYVGCIMLGGIVVNNAILLVDHTNLLRRRDRMALMPAVEEAGRRRLRPILMTALTTILALLPLALGIGEGAEAQAPLARAVIGGLTSSTLITLVFVPVVYAIFERKETKG